jgi:heme-degrading monooxygenase HmoA
VILEHALLPVTPGREAEFEASARIALTIIESAPDCEGAEIRRQEENGSLYLLLVRWTSIEAHMAFRASALFEQWRSLTHSFYSEPVSATHFHESLGR